MIARLLRKRIFRRLSVACVVLIAGLSSLFLASLFAPAALADYQAGTNAYNAKDYATAMREFLPEAERGHPGAMIDLAYLYEHGLGTPQNAGKAVEWLTRAIPAFEADTHNPAYTTEYRKTAAKMTLDIPEMIRGIRSRVEAEQSRLTSDAQRFGVSKEDWQAFMKALQAYSRGDYAAALKGWRPLADRFGSAAWGIANLYLSGLGVGQSVDAALPWIEKAVALDNSRAMFVLSALYELGIGVPQDMNKAVELYARAREAFPAEFERDFGSQIAQRYDLKGDLLSAWRKYANTKSASAKFVAALVFLEYASRKNNPRENSPSQAPAADIYTRHPLINEAKGYLRESARQNFLPARISWQRLDQWMARIAQRPKFENARLASATTDKISRLQKLIDRGDVDAMLDLAILYIKGRGVERDLNKAKKRIFQAWKQVRSQFRSDGEMRRRYSRASAAEQQAYADFYKELILKVREAGSVVSDRADEYAEMLLREAREEEEELLTAQWQREIEAERQAEVRRAEAERQAEVRRAEADRLRKEKARLVAERAAREKEAACQANPECMAAREAERKAERDRKDKEKKAKEAQKRADLVAANEIEVNEHNCAAANSYTHDVVDGVAYHQKTDPRAISLRMSWYNPDFMPNVCISIFDTPKGPIQCVTWGLRKFESGNIGLLRLFDCI